MFSLPDSIISLDDLKHLIDDLEKDKSLIPQTVQDFWQANPRLSNNSKHRNHIVTQLKQLLHQTPSSTCIFAQDPDQDFLGELISWLRTNIYQYIFLEVQIDPMLTGGMVLRTPQHIYDWSWTQKLVQTKPQLQELLTHAR